MKQVRRFAMLILALLVHPVATFGVDLPIRVAVFDGDGVGKSCPQLLKALNSNATDRKFQISRITTEEIVDGNLAEVDLLVHPGGSGGKQGRALGEIGRKAVRDFVREGGGFLGVCAGAYLATNDYDWSLNLIDAKVVDRRHWARGTGTVQLRLSATGTDFFGYETDEMTIYYGQGPLLGRREWDDPDVPDYESLAIFATEIAKNGAPKGVMVRTSAVIRCNYGKGHVFCFSPHPEMTEGLGHLIPIAARWAAGGD